MIEKTTLNAHSPAPPATGASLRARLRLWTIVAFTVTLAFFTALGTLEDRREMLRNDAVQAHALLAHLAEMPEFLSSREAATLHLRPLRELLGAMEAEIDLVASTGEAAPGSGAEAADTVLASRQVVLREGRFELLYRVRPNRYR